MKKIFTLLFAASSLAACQQPDGTDMPTAKRITIEPVITRATEVNFETGDRIGLTILRGGSVYAENSLLTYTGSLFAGELTWYAEAAEAADFAAYYPYTAAGAPTSFTVAADQTTGYGASDLMAAVKQNVLPSAEAVSMVFKHQLSKVVIDIANETGADIAAVVLRNAVPTARVDLAQMSVEADAAAAPAEIRAQTVQANVSYRAIVVPQTVALELAVELASGKVLSQQLAEVTLLQGGQYTVKARVLPEDLQVSLSGEIENWDDRGTIPAAGSQGGEDPELFEDHPSENRFVYAGLEYKTVTLANGSRWMAEPLAYLPAGYTPSGVAADNAHIWYPYELTDLSDKITAGGFRALTDEASIKRQGYLYDFYAAFGGREITEENLGGFEGAQGICPEGWHIPTRMELIALCGLSNKAAGESGNLVDETALFYDRAYSGGSFKRYNEAGWNYVLTGARMQSSDTAKPAFQLTTLYSGNCDEETLAKYEGRQALTYIMSSTPYQKVTGGIQFFAQMTTFTKAYPTGRVSIAYANIHTGMQVRCVENRK